MVSTVCYAMVVEKLEESYSSTWAIKAWTRERGSGCVLLILAAQQRHLDF